MASTWELIDSNFGNIKVKRMQTPQGWLLRTDEGESILYVPDEAKLWEKMEKLDFTAIPSSGQNTLLRRAKIPGGWLLARYTNKTSYEGDLNRTKDRSLEFIPDPKWEWQITLPKAEG